MRLVMTFVKIFIIMHIGRASEPKILRGFTLRNKDNECGIYVIRRGIVIKDVQGHGLDILTTICQYGGLLNVRGGRMG